MQSNRLTKLSYRSNERESKALASWCQFSNKQIQSIQGDFTYNITPRDHKSAEWL